ncbi:MAG TPA: SMC-Scp complex subunit ScpB [Sphingobacterium sp.]|nr:SMC-Scp complex subunit ScpB [Sphingobacterium sp.]
MKNIQQHIEALIFVSDEGINTSDIHQVISQLFPDNEIQKTEIEQYIKAIKEKYLSDNYILELKHIADRYHFLTKSKYYTSVQKLLAHKEKRKLSQAALETLSIIAYRQPITKLEVEQIRGVNCDYTIQRLLDKNLITILGKAESVGRPLLYGTSDEFLSHFGINHFNELPQLKEIVEETNVIGKNNEIEK